MPWNPNQYHKFQAERSAPFEDLLKLVEPRSNITAADLGCGTGELTLHLADLIPDSQVTGIDLSPQMLEKAQKLERPGLRFLSGDQSDLGGNWDLIFSNAALQWSEDHPTLISNLFNLLNPGGQIVVQVPSNHKHISQRLIAETAQEEPFRTYLNSYVRISPVLPIDDYATLFYHLGAENIIVFEKIYGHVLENAAAVLEWVSGTVLVPYFERLGVHKDSFLAVLRKKFEKNMPGNPVFYPFRRTFFSARKRSR